MKHPDFIQPYAAADGKIFEHRNSFWIEPLENDVLIVDIDTRYPEKMFNEGQPVV